MIWLSVLDSFFMIKNSPMKNYFRLSEFVPREDLEKFSANREYLQNVFNLLPILNLFRTCIRKPIYINSGFRTVERNNRVGGVSNSQHLDASAVDFTFDDFDAELFMDFLNNHHSLYLQLRQVIFYDNFIHIAVFSPDHSLVAKSKFIDKRTYKKKETPVL